MQYRIRYQRACKAHEDWLCLSYVKQSITAVLNLIGYDFPVFVNDGIDGFFNVYADLEEIVQEDPFPATDSDHRATCSSPCSTFVGSLRSGWHQAVDYVMSPYQVPDPEEDWLAEYLEWVASKPPPPAPPILTISAPPPPTPWVQPPMPKTSCEGDMMCDMGTVAHEMAPEEPASWFLCGTSPSTYQSLGLPPMCISDGMAAATSAYFNNIVRPYFVEEGLVIAVTLFAFALVYPIWFRHPLRLRNAQWGYTIPDEQTTATSSPIPRTPVQLTPSPSSSTIPAASVPTTTLTSSSTMSDTAVETASQTASEGFEALSEDPDFDARHERPYAEARVAPDIDRSSTPVSEADSVTWSTAPTIGYVPPERFPSVPTTPQSASGSIGSDVGPRNSADETFVDGISDTGATIGDSMSPDNLKSSISSAIDTAGSDSPSPPSSTGREFLSPSQNTSLVTAAPTASPLPAGAVGSAPPVADLGSNLEEPPVIDVRMATPPSAASGGSVHLGGESQSNRNAAYMSAEMADRQSPIQSDRYLPKTNRGDGFSLPAHLSGSGAGRSQVQGSAPKEERGFGSERARSKSQGSAGQEDHPTAGNSVTARSIAAVSRILPPTPISPASAVGSDISENDTDMATGEDDMPETISRTGMMSASAAPSLSDEAQQVSMSDSVASTSLSPDTRSRMRKAAKKRRNRANKAAEKAAMAPPLASSITATLSSPTSDQAVQPGASQSEDAPGAPTRNSDTRTALEPTPSISNVQQPLFTHVPISQANLDQFDSIVHGVDEETWIHKILVRAWSGLGDLAVPPDASKKLPDEISLAMAGMSDIEPTMQREVAYFMGTAKNSYLLGALSPPQLSSCVTEVHLTGSFSKAFLCKVFEQMPNISCLHLVDFRGCKEFLLAINHYRLLPWLSKMNVGRVDVGNDIILGFFECRRLLQLPVLPSFSIAKDGESNIDRELVEYMNATAKADKLLRLPKAKDTSEIMSEFKKEMERVKELKVGLGVNPSPEMLKPHTSSSWMRGQDRPKDSTAALSAKSLASNIASFIGGFLHPTK